MGLHEPDIAHRPRAGEEIVTSLDVGTSNIKCLIAAVAPGQAPRLLGSGVQRSQGIKAGVVANIGEAETALRGAVEQAERSAEVTVENVVVSISCGRLGSETFRARADVAGERVSAEDMQRVVKAARAYAERDGRAIVLMNDLGCILDGSMEIQSPVGMAGSLLEMDMHAVTADEPPLRNLRILVERCYLTVGRMVAAPLASGLAVSTPEERHLGVAVIDIGGGTTTVSGFVHDRFVFCDALAMGGNHVSYDIARQLSCSLEEAERIKTLYGTLLPSTSTAHETISYRSTIDGGMETRHAAQGRITELLRPRYQEILSNVQTQIGRSEFAALIGGRIVLTGGASGAIGLDDFASDLFRAPVRIGEPNAIADMPTVFANGGMATAIGAINTLPLSGGTQTSGLDTQLPEAETGYLKRVGRWLRDGF